MSAQTAIQWTDRTWNPIRGCSRVSPGCDHCYAMRQARRFDTPGGPYEGLTRIGPRGVDWSGKVTLVESVLLEPLSWRKPQRVFVNSMSDLFHPAVPDEWIDRIFAVMALCPHLTFQVLTKRPERMRAYCSDTQTPFRASKAADAISVSRSMAVRHLVRIQWPLPNCWKGVSCEDQPRADERIPLLLQTQAWIRFVSAEPLLGPIQLQAWLPVQCSRCGGATGDDDCDECAGIGLISDGLDWVIAGGESGRGARPCDLDWIRSLVQQCTDAGPAVFVKQLGSQPWDAVDREDVTDHPVFGPEVVRYAEARRLTLCDHKGGDINEWPEDLRVREFPRSAVPT